MRSVPPARRAYRWFDRSKEPWCSDPLIRALTDEQLDALARVLIRLAAARAGRLSTQADAAEAES